MPELSDIIITSVEAHATVYSEKNRTFTMVNRPSYGLSFCIDGKITYTHKGKTYISDRNHAVILPKGASYVLYGSEAGRFPLVNFQCEHLRLDAPLLIPLGNPDSYLADYEMFNNALVFLRSPAKAMSILYDIFHRLSQEQTGVNTPLQPAIAYLEAHFTDTDISNGKLAEKCGISEIYFRQLFGRRFGISPKQYIIDMRIRKAKQLLLSSAVSAAQIAEQCGFTNPYHFSRTFKSVTGLTPTAYRRQNRTYIL